MALELKVKVKWLSEPDSARRLAAVYALLLKERPEESPQPTILELLRRAFGIK